MADRELPGYATAIREARVARGWTRPRLAYEIEQVIKSDSERPPERDNLLRMIRSWENGEHQPKGHNRELLGRAFKMTEARLFEASREAWNLESGWLDLYGTMMAALDPEGLDMERRVFLRQAAAAVGGATLASSIQPGDVEPWERLLFTLQQSGRVDPITIEDLGRMTTDLELLYAEVSSLDLLKPVKGHLHVITRLLSGNVAEAERRQLHSIAGETAGIAGWLASDLGRDQDALAYYETGMWAAREARDGALGAYLVGSASTLPAFRKSPQATLRLLDDGAFGFKTAQATASTRAWLAALEAEAHSKARDEVATLEAFEKAGNAFKRQEKAPLRPRAEFFDPGRLAGERGLCYIRLARFDDAQVALHEARRRLDPAAKIRPRVLTGLATAYAEQGRVAEACQLASESLAIARRTHTALSLSQVKDVRRRLDRWKDARAVRRLDEQLSA
jgi:tetratricopeptide (TPR) repeat protein